MSLLPLAALIAMALLSYRTRWLFYIDSGGHHQRGSLHFLQMLLVYGYVISTDPLPQLNNRGRMLQYLSHKVQSAVQGGDPLYPFCWTWITLSRLMTGTATSRGMRP